MASCTYVIPFAKIELGLLEVCLGQVIFQQRDDIAPIVIITP